MLVLSRRVGETVFIGDGIVVTVIEVQGNRIKLAVSAPKNIPVLRGELQKAARPPNENEGTTAREVLELPAPETEAAPHTQAG
jgi:carbon storage regulator